MPPTAGSARSHLTLLLCTILHAFTHAYGTMLIPLYVMIRTDMHLAGLWQATLLVTIYSVVYALMSYPAGVLADRYDRKWLLGIGLMGNAAAITAMALTRRYEALVAMAVVAGLFGTLFHPAANALAPAHYPKTPGMAIGLLGIGSGIGFFAGPQYAGWRAESSAWSFGAIADWQKPLLEMGLMGLVAAVIFLLFATETPHQRRIATPLGKRLRNRVSAVAGIMSLREFSFLATSTLTSIYLQKARGLSVKQTGFILGSMMLIGVISNPLLVWITSGQRRLPWLAGLLVGAGLFTAAIPHVPVAGVLPVLVVVHAMQLGASALTDAGMFERISPDLRGRASGLFLTIAGTIGALGPWVMGAWADGFRAGAAAPEAYAIPFASLGLIGALAAAATPVIGSFARAGQEIALPQSSAEVVPAVVT